MAICAARVDTAVALAKREGVRLTVMGYVGTLACAKKPFGGVTNAILDQMASPVMMPE